MVNGGSAPDADAKPSHTEPGGRRTQNQTNHHKKKPKRNENAIKPTRCCCSDACCCFFLNLFLFVFVFVFMFLLFRGVLRLLLCYAVSRSHFVSFPLQKGGEAGVRRRAAAIHLGRKGPSPLLPRWPRVRMLSFCLCFVASRFGLLLLLLPYFMCVSIRHSSSYRVLYPPPHSNYTPEFPPKKSGVKKIVLLSVTMAMLISSPLNVSCQL